MMLKYFHGEPCKTNLEKRPIESLVDSNNGEKEVIDKTTIEIQFVFGVECEVIDVEKKADGISEMEFYLKSDNRVEEKEQMNF